MSPGSRIDSDSTTLRAEPDRAFTPTEPAQALETTSSNSFSVQPATRARRGLPGKTGRGRYTIPDNSPETDPWRTPTSLNYKASDGTRRGSDPLIGTPLHPETYDYTGHVLFNAAAGRLWSATTTGIRRSFARLLGIPRRELRDHVTLTFAKVTEYQQRGIVHFHAVVRLDGPGGPDTPPTAWITSDHLDAAIREAVTTARLELPESKALGTQAITWGRQLDIRAIGAGQLDGDGLSDVTVARYIAKYATKGAESAGADLPPLACRDCSAAGYRVVGDHSAIPCGSCDATGRRYDLDPWQLREHHRILIETCWRLGAIPELAGLRLRQWAHMLGFGGHFATKSRTYSTTFGALRQERADYMAAHDPLTAALADSEDLIVINHWAFAGHDDGPTRPRSDSSREEWPEDD